MRSRRLIASQENGSRSGQKSCNHAEDVGIAFGRIIETRSINECDGATIEREGLRYLDDVGAGLKPSSNPKIRGASHVDKLSIREYISIYLWRCRSYTHSGLPASSCPHYPSEVSEDALHSEWGLPTR